MFLNVLSITGVSTLYFLYAAVSYIHAFLLA